jgi:pimeloyl-ACP methyl ester carboxylesterase
MKKYILKIIVILILLPITLNAQNKVSELAKNFGRNTAVGKYINTRGVNLYYEIYGEGEPLLLIHGNNGSMRSFFFQIDFFAEKYKVIAVDSRSQGMSVDTSSVLNYEMMADDFSALLDKLKIDSAYVIGWSDGGINGLLLSIRHPEKVKKLAISGANLVPDASVFSMRAIELRDFNLANLSSLKPDAIDAQTRNTIKLIQMMNVEPNIALSDLQKIKCPVLVIGGDNDLVKASHTLQIFENIPKAYLWILPSAGHSPPIRHKEEFNAKVFEFFKTPFHTVLGDDWYQ